MSTYSTVSFTSRFFKALPSVPLHRAVRSSSARKAVLPTSTSDALEEEDDFTGELEYNRAAVHQLTPLLRALRRTDADLLLECSLCVC